MKPARCLRSGRQRTASRRSESAAVATIASSAAPRSGIPSGPLKAYAASAPNAIRSP